MGPETIFWTTIPKNRVIAKITHNLGLTRLRSTQSMTRFCTFVDNRLPTDIPKENLFKFKTDNSYLMSVRIIIRGI